MAILARASLSYAPIVGLKGVVSFEDVDRAGYNNLGSGGGSWVSIASATNTTALINGQAGDDWIQVYGSGNSIVYGGSGNDKLAGSTGHDQLFGGSGNDILAGDGGNDILNGGAGDDRLSGGSDADTLTGGAGNDSLTGGAGADTLTGGAGADTFLFSADTAVDRITDFTRGQDRIDLGQSWLSGLQLDQPHAGDGNWLHHARAWIVNEADGQHVFVSYTGGLPDAEIVVQTTDGSQLTIDDFVMR